jgi:hypothetical protein
MSNETLDAYVFVPSGSEATMDKLKTLWGAGRVRYAARVLSGEFGSVAFVEVATEGRDQLASLTDLREKLTVIRDAVNPGTSVGLAVVKGPKAPTRWSEKRPIGAYVRIRTEPGQAMTVFGRLNDDFQGDDQFGSAVVAGDWDILVEVDADSLEALGDQIVRINGTAGVLSTDSAIVLNDTTEQLAPGAQ